MKKFLLFVFLLSAIQLSAQLQEGNYPYKAYFDEAYQLYPDVPRGVLEAVSYTNTHIRHINPLAEEASCAGLPGFYGVMGLVLNGKGYFRENLKTVANLSGAPVNDIMTSPQTNILAYAAAYHNLLGLQENKKDLALSISKVLISLSELNISNSSAVNDYTMNLYLYGIFYFLNDKANQEKYGFPEYSIDMAGFFGEANMKVFTAKQINISGAEVSNNEGQIYSPIYLSGPCPDYVQPNCTWVASPNHYTGWNGHTISAIAIHTVQGSYTSCINWFQNPDASAATHYVVASNSSYAGQVTQMVNEDNAGWHVTTENWYAIGYEHEGFVDDPSWYTTTMYQTSAALTRDICTRQSINPLRTFFREVLDDGTVLDDGLHSLGAEGSCIKIKGHQHFPNQTHTDPGPNWDWDYYYKLINNSTPVTTYTAASGNFYDTGGASASYGNDERKFWLIQPTNAQTVTLTFSQFAVEANYDFLYIYDGANEFAPLIGRYNTVGPTTVTSTGGSLFIEFRSDCATVGTGWAATWTSVLLDLVAPTTITSVAGNWQTQNFTASFTDTDNAGGSGIEKSFYQVLDYNGTEWHANAQNGFFADNFDTYNASVWNVPASSGTWNVTSGNLIQSDTSVSNTNIYAALNQNLSNRYIYQFYVKLDDATSGTNQHRLGFHFFSDNGSLTNRGNSYFIFFRQETSKLEFYKVVNDTYTLTKIVDGVTTSFDQWYDLKVIFDRITGKIDVYRDDVLLGTWTDPSPLATTGSYISFRTGNCKAYISELKVYRSRYPSVTVSVGAAATNDIRYQNPNPATYAAKIKSIVNDVAGNLSAIDYFDLNIDWTIPVCNTVNDGTGADISTTTSATTLSANWAASSDPNSGIAKYWYAIGTTSGGTDVVGWTDNALNTTVTKTGLSLTDGQTYYFSIKTENGAGLVNICSSNGVQANLTSGPPANDACANATPLPCGTADLAGTTVNCVSETPGTGCTVSAYGVWYTFTGDGNVTTISSSATFDHEMDIVYGSCGAFTSVVCRDTTAGSTETYTFTPTNGTTYYVYIAYYTTGAITGTFTISRSCCAATPLADDTPVASSVASTNWSYIANASDLTFFGVCPDGTGDKDCYVYSDCFTTQVASSTGTNKADYVIENRHTIGTNITRNGRVSYSTPAYTVEMENNVPNVTSGTITTADLSSNEAFDFYEFYCTETASNYDFQLLSIIDSDVNPDLRVFEFTGDGFKNKSQATWSSTSSSPSVNHEIDIRNVTCTSGRYYGIVVERAGAEDSASVYWLVVNRRPGDPVLSSPTNGAITCAGASQTFSWKPVTDPDGSAVTYRVWVRAGAAPTYSSYTDRSGFLSDTTWTWSPAGGLVAGTTYYWMVFTWDGVDYELCGAGTIWNFTPSGTPASPVAATQTPSGTQIIWDWNTVAGATGYKWNTTNNYGTATDLGNVSTYTQSGLSCGTTYTVYAWAYNGCGYSAATMLSSTTSPLPAAEAGAGGIYTGTPVQLGSITNGPGTCSWGPPAGLDNPNSCQPMASPLSTTTYTLVVNNNGCITTDNVTVTFGGLGHTISGKTIYAGKANAGNPVPNAPTYNAAIYSMYGMIVMLKNYPANDVVAKDTSDASGNYQFTNVMDGNYILSYDKYTVDSMLWANDVNAIDVALMKYFIGSDTLQDPSRCFTAKYKKAANVDNNTSINAVDVARLKAKIGAPYDPVRNFPKGNWVALEKLVSVAGSDINVDLETISYGDYNASSSKYRDSLTNWSGVKSIPDDIIVNSGEYITTSDPEYFEIPLHISAKMNEFSAMGLELNYSAAEYKLVSAYMPKAKTKGAVKINPSFEEVLTDDNDLLVTDADGVIRVVYATTDHFDVAANDEMIVLGFRSLNDPDQGAHEFNLSGTGVMANQYGEETDGTYLLMPKIVVQGRADDTELEFSGHPNPFNSEATITYNLPENGSVKLKVYNVFGVLVTELVNEFQESGKHSVVFPSKNLPAGLYTFMLDYNGEKYSNRAVLKMIH